jgi:hypothetical protein
MDDVIKIGSKWQSINSKVKKTVVHIENDIVFFICAPTAFYGVEQGGAQPLDSFLQRNVKCVETVTRTMYPVARIGAPSYFLVAEHGIHTYKNDSDCVISEPIEIEFKIEE